MIVLILLIVLLCNVNSLVLFNSRTTSLLYNNNDRIYNNKVIHRHITHLYMIKDNNNNDNPYYKGLNAYQILQVGRSADKKEIKLAYRKQVAKYHPDKFPDDEAKKIEGGLRMEKINRGMLSSSLSSLLSSLLSSSLSSSLSSAYFCIG